MQYTLTQIIRTTAQFIIFSVGKLFILHGRRAKSIPTFQRNGRTIIASNHANYLDPFAVVASIRYRDFFRLAPFAFMTASVFFKKPGLRPLLWLAGCFPAHPLPNSHKAAGIEGAVDFLDKGYTLFIFPEGKRVKDEPVPAKRGIVDILALSPRSHLVVARIRWTASGKVENIHLADLPDPSDDPQKILDEIYKL